MTGAKDVNDNIRRAMDLVSALCDGSREWIMSIPARVDHDPDIVISEALREARDHITTFTRERDALTMHMNQVHDTLGGTDTVLTLEAAQHVVFERDEARKERHYCRIVGLQRLDRICAMEDQLAAARELMAEAAQDIEHLVNAEYHGPDDVHPAMRAKYLRDIEIVSRLTAALTQGDA